MLLILLATNAVLAMLVVFNPALRRRPTSMGHRSLGSPGDGREADVISLLQAARSRDRSVAVRALADVAEQPAASAPALVALLDLVRTGVAEIRLAAMHAVKAIVRDVPALAPPCWPDVSVFVRRSIVSGVPGPGSTQPDTSMTMLQEASRDPDAEVRSAAFDTLLSNAQAIHIDVATDALADSDDDVFRVACGALSRSDDDAVVRALLTACGNGRTGREVVALNALGEIARRRPSHLEQIAIADQAVGLRVAAIAAIGAAGLPSSYARLCDWLSAEERDIRRAAASAICDIALAGSPDEIPAGVTDSLLKQLEIERSTSVTLAIIDAVEAIGAIKALSGLLLKLADLHPAVSARALEVIANVERRRAETLKASDSQPRRAQ